MTSHALTIFKIGDLEIRIDPSWLLIAALIVWTLTQQYLPSVLPEQSQGRYFLLASVIMFGLFSSLLLHELAHALVAKRYGVDVRAITFFVFGGVAEVSQEPKSAGAEFRIAVAGPITSLLLSALFGILAVGISGGWEQVATYLSLINLVLAVFNLAPAFPMDGGRILRSWLWHRSGDIVGATKAATLSGRIFGAVLIALGGVFVLGGALVSGIWQMLIGMFIYFSARASYQSFLTQRALTGKTVSDLMSAPPVVVGPDMSLEHLVNDVMLKHPISFVPVVEDAVLLGQIDLALVGRIDPENWPTTYVGDVFTGLESAACVAPSMPVLELLTTMISSGAHKYMVCRDQKVVGVICLSDLLVYLHGTKDRVQG